MLHSIIYSLEAQTQQSPQVEQEPVGVEQGAQCESIMLALIQHPKSVALEMTLDPGVTVPKIWTILMVWCMCLLTFKISMLQFHQSGNTMIISWRSTRSFIILVNAYLMDQWLALQDKTNMFLIWCGPDGEDIYDNFQLNDNKMYDIDYVMEQFELYCEQICNFQAARYQVSQCENETMNAFYHCIQKLCSMAVQ